MNLSGKDCIFITLTAPTCLLMGAFSIGRTHYVPPFGLLIVRFFEKGLTLTWTPATTVIPATR